MFRYLLIPLILTANTVVFHPSGAHAAPVPGLSLHVAPIVDVGTTANLTLTARRWPKLSSVNLHIVSKHHTYSGSMPWAPNCRCFRDPIPLPWRVHPLEWAHAVATVTLSTGAVVKAHVAFQIRGLARGGKRYASGGKPFMQAWLTSSAPKVGTAERYCAWVHASDALGISGMQVQFIVYLSVAQFLQARTNLNGVACVSAKVGHAAKGSAVSVDVIAGRAKAHLMFTPQ